MAMTMFSGLVCVGTLRSFGSVTGICCTTTGIVMRKMMSSTSITSTRGVVLMAAITSSSPPSPGPTDIAMGLPRCCCGRRATHVAAAHEDHVQVGAEVAQVLERGLVAAHEPVVAE